MTKSSHEQCVCFHVFDRTTIVLQLRHTANALWRTIVPQAKRSSTFSLKGSTENTFCRNYDEVAKKVSRGRKIPFYLSGTGMQKYTVYYSAVYSWLSSYSILWKPIIQFILHPNLRISGAKTILSSIVIRAKIKFFYFVPLNFEFSLLSIRFTVYISFNFTKFNRKLLCCSQWQLSNEFLVRIRT